MLQQIACSKEAADLWAFIEQETQRIQGEAAEAAARAAAEQAMPRTKRKREVQPWKDLGSEVGVMPTRALNIMLPVAGTATVWAGYKLVYAVAWRQET